MTSPEEGRKLDEAPPAASKLPLALLIAWRYLRRPGDRLVTAGGVVSLLGLVIGVMALVISMALMTGYRSDLEQKLLGGSAEIYLYATADTVDAKLLDTIRRVPGVAWAFPSLFHGALVTSEDHKSGEQVMIKGISEGVLDRSPMMARIAGSSPSFRAKDGTAGIALGSWLARKLGVGRGSLVSVTVATENSGSVFPRTRAYVVTNVFDTGFFEFDSRWIFTSVENASRLFTGESEGNVVEIKVVPGASVTGVMAAVDKATGRRYAITDWRKSNAQLFSLLRIQQLALFLVIGLIVFVSTFNIVSTLVMTVHEKRKEVGILLTMGSDRKLIRRVFIWYGTLVGLMGTATGIILGVLTNWVITRWKLVSFGPEIAQVYFVTSIPFVTRAVDLVVIGTFSLAVSWLATLVPSLRAARLDPIASIRRD